MLEIFCDTEIEFQVLPFLCWSGQSSGPARICPAAVDAGVHGPRLYAAGVSPACSRTAAHERSLSRVLWGRDARQPLSREPLPPGSTVRGLCAAGILVPLTQGSSPCPARGCLQSFLEPRTTLLRGVARGEFGGEMARSWDEAAFRPESQYSE